MSASLPEKRGGGDPDDQVTLKKIKGREPAAELTRKKKSLLEDLIVAHQGLFLNYIAPCLLIPDVLSLSLAYPETPVKGSANNGPWRCHKCPHNTANVLFREEEIKKNFRVSGYMIPTHCNSNPNHLLCGTCAKEKKLDPYVAENYDSSTKIACPVCRTSSCTCQPLHECPHCHHIFPCSDCSPKETSDKSNNSADASSTKYPEFCKTCKAFMGCSDCGRVEGEEVPHQWCAGCQKPVCGNCKVLCDDCEQQQWCAGCMVSCCEDEPTRCKECFENTLEGYCCDFCELWTCYDHSRGVWYNCEACSTNYCLKCDGVDSDVQCFDCMKRQCPSPDCAFLSCEWGQFCTNKICQECFQDATVERNRGCDENRSSTDIDYKGSFHCSLCAFFICPDHGGASRCQGNNCRKNEATGKPGNLLCKRCHFYSNQCHSCTKDRSIGQEHSPPYQKIELTTSQQEERQQLFQACSEGNIGEARKLLSKSANVRQTRSLRSKALDVNSFLTANSAGQELLKSSNLDYTHQMFIAAYPSYFPSTALYIACKCGHLEMVQVLLEEYKADPNKGNVNGWTPLMAACFYGQLAVVQMLIQQDTINVNAKSIDLDTALLAASAAGKEEYSSTDINHNQKNEENSSTSVFMEITAGVYDRELYAAYVDNASEDIHNIYTCYRKAKNNAKTEKTDKNEEARLISCKSSILKLLLDHQAEVNHSNDSEYTALHLAADSSLDPIEHVEILCDNGAQVNQETTYGFTALLYAAHHGHPELVQVLINHGAHVNASNGFDVTALMEAAANDHLSVVKVLLKNNADVELKNRHGQTAMTLAGGDTVKKFLEDWTKKLKA